MRQRSLALAGNLRQAAPLGQSRPRPSRRSSPQPPPGQQINFPSLAARLLGRKHLLPRPQLPRHPLPRTWCCARVRFHLYHRLSPRSLLLPCGCCEQPSVPLHLQDPGMLPLLARPEAPAYGLLTNTTMPGLPPMPPRSRETCTLQAQAATPKLCTLSKWPHWMLPG